MAPVKLPSFQFYPGDWKKDPALRACSLAARGLWIDILCLMFESPRRGYLEHANGQPVTPAQLARMVGATMKEVAALIEEMSEVEVFSRSESGAIFSRRLVRDEQIRQVRATGGDKGAEHGHKGGRPPKGLSRGSEITPSKTPSGQKGEPLENPPSSSSSTSSSPSGIKDIAAKPPVARPRDDLWDAIVEVTGADSSLPKTASHIGGVKKALLAAKPPYTAADVLGLPDIAAVHLPWSAGRVLTVGEIEKHIHLVRSTARPVPANGRSRASNPDRGAEYLRLGLDAAAAKESSP